VKEVKASDFFSLFQEGGKLSFFDVPGYGDSDLRIQDEEISESIKFRQVEWKAGN